MRYRHRQFLKALLLCFLFSLVVTLWNFGFTFFATRRRDSAEAVDSFEWVGPLRRRAEKAPRI